MPETFKRNRFIVGGNAGEAYRLSEVKTSTEIEPVDINSYQLI